MNHEEVVGGEILDAVMGELWRARANFPAFHSAHEGFAVLLEEVEELKAEVFQKHREPERLREEAIQVAAMAIRFIYDVVDEGKKHD